MTPRHVAVLGMRARGMTFRAIADELGVSVSRASQIVRKARGAEAREAKLASLLDSQNSSRLLVDTAIGEALTLSVRTENAVYNAGLQTIGDLYVAGLSLIRAKGIGRKSYREIEEQMAATGWGMPRLTP